MPIQSVQKSADGLGFVLIRDGVRSAVPNAPGNRDYTEIVAWAAAGGKIAEAAPIQAAAPQVSAAQAKTALYDAGLYPQVEAAIGGSAYALIRIWWSSAQVWRRDNPYILAVQAELGLTDDQVDDLFEAAAKVST